ncbi:MAG TPA: hypothetical protein VGR22_01115 [Thermomicrobiales bacterium]|nr:hypothetical protein [Thermomicrobiales bacterium]
MPPAHRNTSRAAERRRQRRQRRSGQEGSQRSSQVPKMAPLQLDPRRAGASSSAPVAVPTAKLEPDMEFAIVRRDLWRLTLYSIICFALMIAVLYVLNA